MLRTSLVILLFALSASSSAEEFDYNYVFLGYGNTDFDNINSDGDGITLGGSYGFTDRLHGFASYDAAALGNNGLGTNVDASRWRAGVGYNTSMSDNLDLYARLSYEYVEIDVPILGGVDDNGLGFGVGLRFAASDQLELVAGVNYVDYGDFGDDTSLEVGGLYSFTEAFALGLAAETSDDFTSYSISGRFYFGR